ncbi:hypothetical protein M758_5G100800 [Ceratodon purpureus]|nr:hypothetical protein M758_5G100800 [Ceratodon purpureus]
MRSFSIVTSFWIIVVCLGGLATQVMGSGPADAFPPLPVYNYSMSDCSRFRNEAVLRPHFIVWPEYDGVQFRYCCEYQANGASSTFELSKFSYYLNSGALQPAPYFDVGIVDKQNWPTLWKPHWQFWRLASDRRRPRLYCEVSDLRRLYRSRFWRKAMRKAFFWWLIPSGMLGFWAFQLSWLGRTRKIGPYKNWGSIEPEKEVLVDTSREEIISTSWNALGRGLLDIVLAVLAPALVGFIYFCDYCGQNSEGVLKFFEAKDLEPKTRDIVALSDKQKLLMKHIRVLIRPRVILSSDRQLEEGFADASHILLVAMLASCLMEGTARSDLLSWRAAIMYNGAVAYSYLALFAVVSACIRHSLFLELQHESDWRWQKVFAQLVALLMMGTYLVLVEDATEHSLDLFAGPVIGTCVAASVWSAGVEMVVIARYLWHRIFRNFVCIIYAGILARSRPLATSSQLPTSRVSSRRASTRSRAVSAAVPTRNGEHEESPLFHDAGLHHAAGQPLSV